MSTKLEKLQELIKISADSLSKEDFLANFKIIVDLIKKLKISNQEMMDSLDTKYAQVVNDLVVSVRGNSEAEMMRAKQAAMDYCAGEMARMMAKMDKKMAEMKNGKDGRDAIDGKDGNTIINVSTFSKAPADPKKGDLMIVDDTGETYIFE